MRPTLAEQLDLEAHPEGGWFRQTWASTAYVGTGPGHQAQALVPAGTWQRTVPGEQDALVSCQGRTSTPPACYASRCTRPGGVLLSRRGIHHAFLRRPCQDTRIATLATALGVPVRPVSPGFDFDDFELAGSG